MAQEQKVNKEYIAELTGKTNFSQTLLTKDYYITRLLCAMKDVRDIYFKGGTALQKIFLNHSRLSEDIDFTVTSDVKEKEREIRKLLKDQKFIKAITKDKSVDKFIRMVIHYDDFFGEPENIFIDLNERSKLLTKPEIHAIKHFYPDISLFNFQTLSEEEMIAEKVAAAIGRNKPRDHYDIYLILKKQLPINMKLVEEKCKQSGDEFSIINMFNKAKKLKNRWDQDMIPLLPKPESFANVMQTLAKHFKLKYEKEKIKKK